MVILIPNCTMAMTGTRPPFFISSLTDRRAMSYKSVTRQTEDCYGEELGFATLILHKYYNLERTA